MAKNDLFPWELLKAECLRLVCSQLTQSGKGTGYTGSWKKDDMIEFLHSVNERGLELALKKVASTSPPRKSEAGTSTAQTPRKRKNLDAEKDVVTPNEASYNTRFKGVKRVKLSRVVPDDPEPIKPRSPRKRNRNLGESASAGPFKPKRGRPRKITTSAPLSNAKASTSKQTGENGKAKSGRGRLRKIDPASAAPLSIGKQVFDGVLLPFMKPFRPEVPAGQSEEVPTERMTESAILPILNGFDQGTHSQGHSSDKENDPNNMVGADYEADIDADGDPDVEVQAQVS